MIKACVREAYECARFGKVNGELTHTQLSVLIIFALMNPTVNAVMYLVVAGILYLGSYRASSGAVTPGVIMAAISYTTQLLNSIMSSTMLFQQISRGMASWKRVRQLLESTPQMEDGTAAKGAETGTLEFRDVSFSYPGTNQIILQHINLKVNQGETVAIMGSTGCGKTSMVQLIPRFYDTTEGKALVDGVDVRDYQQKTLRDRIGIVLQKSELFSATIADNIRWGDPQKSEEAVIRAAQVAQADDFIRCAPQEYQTPVSERGTSLSGGQKQRLSIARAVLKSPEILILDNSTSALDLKTEAAFYEALQNALPDTTKIIVAQRIASVRQADRIVVLDHGEIAAMGSHQNLLRDCQVYREIYYSQMGEEEAYG
ncbi:MAG: ABC transporter ATP-binding protein/permease [Lachnospiraceae bacterium]|nr:ABC transporter ATP-binding protein/permease [Lachnospiraceae bacterium]